MLNYEQIMELIKSIDSSSLRVFELEDQGFKLKLSKNEETSKEIINKDNDSNKISNSSAENNTTIINNNEIIKVDNEEEDFNVVKSPLVGTYYSSGTPGGKPYVQKGDKVKKGDVLCIVEAMKIMNEITAEYDGEIIEVLRSDEDIVEYGMELFKIK
ncbi:acetyl-CoA carboxylase biotin carboxyl carrier protein [Clostridium sp. Sa3CUN1]|uniref:Biotin carboxyl carrier protein of acetyl-CoA carboxylase n=1 Tax=Clostridium gallinarum TaxID=2762246 RepID=A0ABR8Q7L4_9CLOT|nr:acetyl-CoA carboxylase biotin carboxyl carrier protein [Clostridium gallinarum]MBD7916365.1 acetyl-CoA carboxylase biotin carboxyl carrier protein [Clostridium gallinarum]